MNSLKNNGHTIFINLPGKPAANKHDHQALLQAVLNSSAHLSIVSLNKNYCYTAFSSSHSMTMKKLWGVDIEIGKNVLGYIADETNRARIKSSIDRVLQGESFTEVQFESLSKGYYEFYWNPVVQRKKVIGVSAFIQNITDRKLAEEEIKNSEDKFKDLVENISDLVCTHDIDGKIISVNPAAEKLLGYEMQTLLTMRIQDILVPDQVVQYAVYIDLIQKHGSVSGDMKVRTSAGDERIWEFHNTLRINGVENPIVRGFAKDITDRKLGEKALQESEQRLIQGEIFARFGNWELDLNEQMVYASEGARRIYGSEKEWVTLEELKRFRLPEYNRIADEAMQRLIVENEPYDIELKIKRQSDGKVIDVHSKAKYDAMTNTVFGTIQDITERKKAEAALVKSEMLYRSMLNSSPDGIVISDLDGRLQLVSPAALKIFHYRHPLEVLGRQLTDFVADNDKDRIMANIANMFEQKKSSSGEYIGLCSDGSSFPVEVNTNFIRNAQGVPTNLITIIRDITERRQSESALARITEQLKQTATIAKVGGWEYNFETKKRFWAEETCRMLETDPAFIAGLGDEPNFSFYTPGSQQIVQAAVQAGIDNGTPFDLELQMVTGKGNHIWARFQGTFLREHGRTIKAEGVIQDITARKLAEAELEDSRIKYHGLSDAALEAIFITEDNICIEHNHMAEKLFGYTHKEIVGKNGLDFITFSEREMVMQHIKEGFDEAYEVSALRKDGTTFPCLKRGKQMKYKGRNVRVTSLTDISELKERENEIKRHQKFTDVLLNSVPTPVFFKDTNGRYLGCNEAFSSQVGIVTENIIGKTVKDIWPGYQAAIYQQKDEELFRNPVHQVYESTITDKDSAVRDVIFAKDAFYDESGNLAGLVGAYIDITEKKRLEEATKEAQERIIKIARQVPGVIYQFRLNPDGTYTFPYVSESLYLIFQVSPEEFYADPGSAFKKIHPDDYPDFHESIMESAKNLTAWQHECRVVLNDGSIRHMYGSSVPEAEADGSILWHGFITDITEHKFTEERIRQLSKAVEQSPVSIVITDTTGAIQYVNPKFVDVTGYSFDEAIGKNPSILKSGYTSDEEYKKLWTTIKNGNTWRGDLHNRKKNGELYWESATISPVFNEHGETTHFLAVKEDITERVASEQKLQEGLKSYEFVNKATSDTIWEWDIKSNTLNRNENFAKTFGYSLDIIDNSPQWAGKNIHPDDYERVKQIIDVCIKDKQDNWQAEYRYCSADGTYKYVYDRAFVLFDHEGIPYRMYGAMTDLTEKQNLKSELANQQLKQQKQLLEVNIQAHEEEKSELGKELHDNISQMLATVKMYLGLAKAGRTIPEFDIISKSYDYVEETITELRKLSHSLVPPSLGEIGLQEALEELVNVSSIIKDINVKLSFDKKLKSCNIGKKIELMIYRIVQEQLNNIGKYALAKNVSVILKKEKGGLQLTVSDDGVGFDSSTKGKGIGLRNMLNRVEYYSGTLQIISAPGAGCKIIVKIPFDFNNEPV